MVVPAKRHVRDRDRRSGRIRISSRMTHDATYRNARCNQVRAESRCNRYVGEDTNLTHGRQSSPAPQSLSSPELSSAEKVPFGSKKLICLAGDRGHIRNVSEALGKGRQTCRNWIRREP